MKKVGFVGWRGMVGSVLMSRMTEEKTFSTLTPTFLTTSQAGQAGPEVNGQSAPLQDAYNIDCLKELDIVVSCQGGDYTKKVYAPLRAAGWQGYWIDAASALRMDPDSLIVLDPLNKDKISTYLDQGGKNLIGGNCTVSLMMMGMGGLLKEGLVNWINASTYQAYSGAGAATILKFLKQIQGVGHNLTDKFGPNLDVNGLTAEQHVSQLLRQEEYNMVGNLFPWIDSPVPETGQTREEWKAEAEMNKIMGYQGDQVIPVDGICVRVGALRSHAQALMISLNKDVDLKTLEDIIGNSTEWTEFVPNDPDQSKADLTPVAVAGTHKIRVGRLRHSCRDRQLISLFTVGDQLLWGAAEPVLRALQIVLKDA